MNTASAAVTPPPARYAAVLSPYERLCGWLLVWHPLLWRSRPVDAVLLSAATGLLAWAAIGRMPTSADSAWTTGEVDTARWAFAMATIFAQFTLLFMQARYPFGELRRSRQLRLAAFNLLGLGLIAWPFLRFDLALAQRMANMLPRDEATAIAFRSADSVQELCQSETSEDRRRTLAATITSDLNRFRLHPAPNDAEKVYRWAQRQAVTGCEKVDSPLVSRFDAPVSSAITVMRSRIEAIRREQNRLHNATPSLQSWWLLALGAYLGVLSTISRGAVGRLKDRCRIKWPRGRSWPRLLLNHERNQVSRRPLAWALGETKLYSLAFTLSTAMSVIALVWDKNALDAVGFYLLMFAMLIACPLLILRLNRHRPDLHEWHSQLKVVSVAGITALAACVPLLAATLLADRLTMFFWGFLCVGAAYFVMLFFAATMLGGTLHGATALAYWFVGAVALLPFFYLGLVDKNAAELQRASLLLLWPVSVLLLGVASAMRRRWKPLAALAALVTSCGVGVAPGITTDIVNRVSEDGGDGVTFVISVVIALPAVLAVLRLFVWPTLERGLHEPR